MRGWILSVVAAAGCGRLAFDARPDADGDSVDAAEPTTGPWATVYANGNSTCAIQEDGSAWCFGSNLDQNLGVGTPRAFASPPLQVTGTWRTFAMGPLASCGLQTDGTLWCWGNDFFGGIPDGGGPTFVASPLKIGTDTDWTEVVVGTQHGCALKQDATLWCWGDNGDFQFSPTVPTATTPTQVRSNVRAVSAHAVHTFVVDTDGSMWVMGNIEAGEGGTGAIATTYTVATRVGTDSDWATVTAAFHRTCATKTTGTMWCTGEGDYGALGHGTEDSTADMEEVTGSAPFARARVGVSHTCGIDTADTVWCWGASMRGQYGDDVDRASVPQQIAPAKSLATGDAHTCLVTPAGVLRCTGSNHTGQIRQPAASSLVPVNQGGSWAYLSHDEHSACGIDTSGGLSCWGANDNYNLGLGDRRWRQTPTALPLTGWTRVAVGTTASLGLRGGLLYWWGTEYGLGGVAMQPTQLLPAITDFTQITVGGYHYCALRGNGDLYCFGANNDGRLGTGDTVPRGTPTLIGTNFTTVAAGDLHTCGDQGSGPLCWGYNNFGGLGDGSTTPRSTPTAVSCAGCAGKTVKQFAAGNGWSLVLMTDGDTFGWGPNESGQLGNTTQTSTLVGVPAANTGPVWDSIAVGDVHGCGLSAGALYCWGHADEGQTGDNDTLFARSTAFQIGTDTDWQQVVLGYHTSCALKTNGTRYCWGANHSGTYADELSWLPDFVAITPEQ